MDNRMKAALLGGLVAGIPSALPFLSICCLIWALGGGFLAVFMYMKNAPTVMTPGDGARLGVRAGVIGAIAYLVIALPITLLTGAAQIAASMQQAGGETAGFAGMAAGLGAFAVVVGAAVVFGLTVAGAAIGAAVLGRSRPGGTGTPPPPPPTDYGAGGGYGGTGTGGYGGTTPGGGYGGGATPPGSGFGGTTGGGTTGGTSSTGGTGSTFGTGT